MVAFIIFTIFQSVMMRIKKAQPKPNFCTPLAEYSTNPQVLKCHFPNNRPETRNFLLFNYKTDKQYQRTQTQQYFDFLTTKDEQTINNMWGIGPFSPSLLCQYDLHRGNEEIKLSPFSHALTREEVVHLVITEQTVMSFPSSPNVPLHDISRYTSP